MVFRDEAYGIPATEEQEGTESDPADSKANCQIRCYG